MSIPTANRTKSLTVLVVEDEDPIRMLVRFSLENRGYHVLCASDGQEALQMAEEHQGTIDILVTDLAMPGLGGIELAERLHVFRPHMKILLMSGNAEPVSLSWHDDSVGMLSKPFSPSQLLERLQAISDSPN